MSPEDKLFYALVVALAVMIICVILQNRVITKQQKLWTTVQKDLEKVDSLFNLGREVHTGVTAVLQHISVEAAKERATHF